MQIARRSSSPATSKTSTRLDAENAAWISDRGLVDLIADGDRRAFETLYLRHRSHLFRYLIRRIGAAVPDLLAGLNGAERRRPARPVRACVPGAEARRTRRSSKPVTVLVVVAA